MSKQTDFALDNSKKSKSFSIALPPNKKPGGSPALRSYIGSPSLRAAALSSSVGSSPSSSSPISSPGSGFTPGTGIHFASPGKPSALSLSSDSQVSDKRHLSPLSQYSSPAEQDVRGTTYTSDELYALKDYLNKKQSRDDSRGMFKLSKAMKWYLFYVFLICGGLYLYFAFPNALSLLLEMNTVLVILILGLNYGLTFISYLLSAWPAAKNSMHKAEGDVVFATFERTLIIFLIVLFVIDVVSSSVITWEVVVASFVSRLALNTPHILTSMIAFPRRATSSGTSSGKVALQHFGFFLRIIAHIGSIVAILVAIQMFGGLDSWLISVALPMIPFVVFMFFYGRARVYNKIFPVTKKHKFILFGEVPIREVMLFCFLFTMIIWVAAFIGLRFFFMYNFAPAIQALLLSQFSSYSTLNFLPFLWLSSTLSLVVFGVPALYHSLLDYPTKRIIIKKYRMGKKSSFKKALAFFNCGAVEDEEESEVALSPRMQAEKSEVNPLHIELDMSEGSRHDYMKEVSLVIACHMSEVNIVPTLNAAIAAKFPNRNIFVAHNGGSLAPPDKTGRVVRSNPAYDGVHYFYLPEGNKSIAMHWAVTHMVKTKYVMMIDDDVMLPSNVDIEGAYHELELDDKMKATAFTIRGIDTSNLWQVFQHIEYMQSGFNKVFQAQYGSVLTCHGAIALWKSDMCREVFLQHNGEFHGEDLQMGLILRRMNKNYTIGCNAVEPVPTTAPKSIFYEATKNEKSLFVQRIFSWDMAAHHFLGDFMSMMFLNWERPSLVLKPFLLLELWTQFQDWFRLVFIVALLLTEPVHLLYMMGLLMLIQVLSTVIFDRVVLSNRPDVQSSLWILVLYPFYNLILISFRFCGLLVNMFYYTPWNPPAMPISDREDRGEIPPAIIGEYQIEKEQAEYYWDNIWKNPSQTYKKVAQKTKLPKSPLKSGHAAITLETVHEESVPVKSTGAFSPEQQQQLSLIFQQQLSTILEKQNQLQQKQYQQVAHKVDQLQQHLTSLPSHPIGSLPKHGSQTQLFTKPPLVPRPLSASFSAVNVDANLKRSAIVTDEDLMSALSSIAPAY